MYKRSSSPLAPALLVLLTATKAFAEEPAPAAAPAAAAATAPAAATATAPAAATATATATAPAAAAATATATAAAPLGPPPPAPPLGAPPAYPPRYGAPPVYPYGFRYPSAEVRPLVREEAQRHWYGLPSLIGTAASDTLFLVGLGGSEALVWVGVVGHVATSPIVHWAHGNIGRGFLSLGLNIATPYLGLLALFTGGSTFGIAGAVIGVVGWPALDIALLHYEDAPGETNTKVSGLDVRFLGVVPTVDKDKKGLSVAFAF